MKHNFIQAALIFFTSNGDFNIMQIISEEKLSQFKNFLETHNFFYVIAHKDPDGDAIYSCLGLKGLLDAKGLSYQLLSAGPFKRPEIRNHANLFSNQMTFLSEP